jgi:hypothetical protein
MKNSIISNVCLFISGPHKNPASYSPAKNAKILNL